MLILELAFKEIFKEAFKSFVITAASAIATKSVDHLYETRIKAKPKKQKAATKKQARRK